MHQGDPGTSQLTGYFDGRLHVRTAPSTSVLCTLCSVVKVLIDLRMVRGHLHGIARYALELARRLPALEPGWQFTGLTAPAGVPDDLGELAPRIPLVKATSEFLSVIEQPTLLTDLLRQRPTLFHATSFSVPSLWPGKLVVTLHDANHLALSESASVSRTAYYRLVVGHALPGRRR